MSRARKTFSNEFKAKVALEAIKGYKSLNELAAEYQVHPNAIGNWKKQALESFVEIFSNRRGPKAQVDTELTDQLYKQIGKQQVELDWLKKNLILSVDNKRGLIESGSKILTVQQQFSLIRLSRSSYYYNPLGITEEELEIMNWIDKTDTVYLGAIGRVYAAPINTTGYAKENIWWDYENQTEYPPETNIIRGTAGNDIFVGGYLQFVQHWNGASWKRYEEIEGDGTWYSMSVKDNLIIAVGENFSAPGGAGIARGYRIK